MLRGKGCQPFLCMIGQCFYSSPAEIKDNSEDVLRHTTPPEPLGSCFVGLPSLAMTASVRTRNTGHIPGKGDLVTSAVSEFGKTFWTLQEKSQFETFADFMVLLRIF